MLLRSPHGRTLDLARAPRIIGVLNVTPDSFVAESRVQARGALLRRARSMLRDGADVLEIGGESTGPGSHDVSLTEESQRVIPAVRALRKHCPDAWIAVDTWKAAVASEAIAAGADLVNDVTAGRGDRAMLPLLASIGAPIVLMYAKDSSPRTTITPRRYRDVVETVHRFLLQRIDAAERAGVSMEQIIVDPGLGHFVSADSQYSFELLRSLSRLADLAPVLVSPARKSFLSDGGRLSPAERLPGTLAASIAAVQNGACLIRTHDVAATRQALEVFRAAALPSSHLLR